MQIPSQFDSDILSRPSFYQDPYPTYQEIRRSGPVWMPLKEEYSSDGIWFFGAYQDAVELLKQTSSISKNVGAQKTQNQQSIFDLILINRDGKDHIRLRNISAPMFTRNRLNQINSLATEISQKLVQEIINKDATVDLVQDYSELFPIQVIANLIGLPNEDRTLYRHWARTIGIDSFALDANKIEARKNSIIEIQSYFDNLINSQYSPPEDSLLAYYYDAKKRGDISHDELIANVAFMLLSGHETTIDLINSALYLLMTHIEQRKKLQQDLSLLPSTIEETLRYESPLQRSTFRFLKQSIKLSGFEVPPNTQIAVLIGCANRDESIFNNANQFDITRNPNPHIAFGTGVHVCQGRNLARLEASIAISHFLPFLDQFKLLNDGYIWRKTSLLRGLEKLIVARI